MRKIQLTYQPTRDPKDEQPATLEFDTISAAVAAAYDLRTSKGYHAATEVREGGVTIYDKKALADSVYRIYAFVHLDSMSLDEASERVAREDGH